MPHHRRRRQLVPWALASGIAAVGLVALGAAALVASGRMQPPVAAAPQAAQVTANDAPARTESVPQPGTESPSPNGLAETATSAPTDLATPTASAMSAPTVPASERPANASSDRTATPGSASSRATAGTATAPASAGTTGPAPTSSATARTASPSSSGASSVVCPTGVVEVTPPTVSDAHVDAAWVKQMTGWHLAAQLAPQYVTSNDITWSHGTVDNGTTASVTIGALPRIVGTISGASGHGGQVSADAVLGGTPVLRAGRLVRISGSTTGWWALADPVTTTLSGLPTASWTDASFAACSAPRIVAG